MSSNNTAPTLFVGSYTDASSKIGLRAYTFDESSVRLSLISETEQLNASYLCKHPTKDTLYSVTEGAGKDAGVMAYGLDKGQLQYLNEQPAHGDGPCHVTTDPAGRVLAIANYGSGSLALYPILENGQLAEASCTIQHEGKGQHPTRQTQAHAHQVIFNASGNKLFVCDLGINKVMMYDLDPSTLTLSPGDPAFASLHDGAGPRHMLFHTNGQDVFVLNELDSSLSHFSYASGKLELIETLSTLQQPFDGETYPSAIRMHPELNCIYSSNRGHESIAQFSFNNGRLKLEHLRSTEGNWPRDFCFDSSGKYLVVANQFSNSVVIFSVDTGSGKILDKLLTVDIPSPACVYFI